MATGEPAARCRALDHVSLTVPDLDQAAAFFVRAFGARELYRRAWAPPPEGDPDMAARFDMSAHAAFRLVKMDLGGCGLELFEYRAPDLEARRPRNCDAGGCHLGLLVDDVDVAAARLRALPGVRLLGDVSEIGAGHPLAGRRWIYFLTPWGQQLELVSPIPPAIQDRSQ